MIIKKTESRKRSDIEELNKSANAFVDSSRQSCLFSLDHVNGTPFYHFSFVSVADFGMTQELSTLHGQKNFFEKVGIENLAGNSN